MASIKIKFRPSQVKGKEGSIYYQVIHNRVVRQITTDYKIFCSEWDGKSGSIVCNCHGRIDHLHSINEQIEWDSRCFDSVLRSLVGRRTSYTTDELVYNFEKEKKNQSVFNFMKDYIARLKRLGKTGTAENYQTTLNSFTTFRNSQDLLFSEMDTELIMMYESYLSNRGISKNSSSFYMRILRAVYNRATEKGLIEVAQKPFRYVYTGIDKTIKRAISIHFIKQIKLLDLSVNRSLDFARDMFLFSFYTRGMSFIDMAYLKKKNLSNGVLSGQSEK